MKSKEELYSPVYGCVFLNEKEEVRREDFDKDGEPQAHLPLGGEWGEFINLFIFLHKELFSAIYMFVWLVIATRKDVKPNVRHTHL